MAKDATVSNVCDIITMVSAWKDQWYENVRMFFIFVKILLTCYYCKIHNLHCYKTFALLLFCSNLDNSKFHPFSFEVLI